MQNICMITDKSVPSERLNIDNKPQFCYTLYPYDFTGRSLCIANALIAPNR